MTDHQFWAIMAYISAVGYLTVTDKIGLFLCWANFLAFMFCFGWGAHMP